MHRCLLALSVEDVRRQKTTARPEAAHQLNTMAVIPPYHCQSTLATSLFASNEVPMLLYFPFDKNLNFALAVNMLAVAFCFYL